MFYNVVRRRIGQVKDPGERTEKVVAGFNDYQYTGFQHFPQSVFRL